MPEERDTVTEVLKLTVTVEKNLEQFLDHEEWRQEIMYAINHKAGEDNPEQAIEKGFFIQVGITKLPPPCGGTGCKHTCCADCTEVENPRLCDHQCTPLRDGEVSWEQPHHCEFYDELCILLPTRSD